MNPPSGPIARLRGDWPFAAGKSPVFYGWIMAVIATLGILLSVPGQTMGMAVFADAFFEVTGLVGPNWLSASFWAPSQGLFFLTWPVACLVLTGEGFNWMAAS